MARKKMSGFGAAPQSPVKAAAAGASAAESHNSRKMRRSYYGQEWTEKDGTVAGMVMDNYVDYRRTSYRDPHGISKKAKNLQMRKKKPARRRSGGAR